MEITLKSIKSDNFGNTWNLKFFNLLSEICFRIFNDDTDSSVELLTIERLSNAHLKRSRCLLFRNFLKSPAEMNRAIFFSKELFLLIFRMFIFKIFLECFYTLTNLLLFDVLFNLRINFFHFFAHYFLIFFFQFYQIWFIEVFLNYFLFFIFSFWRFSRWLFSCFYHFIFNIFLI